jgi:hypothetical protein
MTRRALQPSSPSVEPGKGDGEGDDEWCCMEGHAALSRTVSLVAVVCRRPKPIHGVQTPPYAIRSKFWAQASDLDDSEDDGDVQGEPSTPEFIKGQWTRDSHLIN